MALNGRIIAITCCSLMIITCILYIISNALPQWGSVHVEPVKSTIGLWRTCRSKYSERLCVNFALTCSHEVPSTLSTCNKMLVSRAFVTIACILSGLSALCFLGCILTRTESNQSVIIISKIISFICFIAGVIGVAVGIAFVVDFPVLDYKLDASAIIGIIAVVINVVCATLSIMIR